MHTFVKRTRRQIQQSAKWELLAYSCNNVAYSYQVTKYIVVFKSARHDIIASLYYVCTYIYNVAKTSCLINVSDVGLFLWCFRVCAHIPCTCSVYRLIDL